MEHWSKDTDRAKPKYSKKPLFEYHFVYRHSFQSEYLGFLMSVSHSHFSILGTALQTGRSRVRFPMVSVDFSLT
jgi:hypothetical protein